MARRSIVLCAVLLGLLLAAQAASAQNYFSVVVLPDTQVYSKSYPQIFKIQTDWIVRNAAYHNIKFVLHAGDVVDSGATNPAEWENAKAALDLIDQAGIPLLIAMGNHDYDDLAQTRSSETFNRYFGIERYQGKPWFGGAFEPDRAENVYALFDVNGRKYLVLVLEFGPRDAVIEWADGVLAAHPDATAIILTHSYLHDDGMRTHEASEWNPKRYGLGGDANDGEDLWHKLIKKHPNVRLVLSGHTLGTGVARRVDVGEHGNLVFQVLANYQMQANGGDGYLRLLKFYENGNIDVLTYSPYTWAYKTDAENQFVIGDAGLAVVSGRVMNTVSQQGVPGARVTLEDVQGNVKAAVFSDEAGRYDLVAPEGCYILRTELSGYEGSAALVATPNAVCRPETLALRPIGVWAGTGRTLTGDLAEGTAADIVLMNERLAMAIAVTFDDPQLTGVTKGKPVDLAVTGQADAFDWILMPYLSLTQPTDWAVRTVRNTDVAVVEVTGEQAVVEASGVFTELDTVTVRTTYTLAKDRPWVHVRSVITNTGPEDVTLWVGDVMDNDDGTQVAIIPGYGTVTSGAAQVWTPEQTWIGQYGTSAQAFALVYPDRPEGFDAFGGALWIMSRIPVTIPAGGQYELNRYIVAVPTEGYAAKADALKEVVAHLITPYIWAFEEQAEVDVIGNDNTGATFALSQAVAGEGTYVLQVTPSGQAAETKIAAPLSGLAISKWTSGETLVIRAYLPPENEMNPARFFLGMADLTTGWEWVDGVFSTTEAQPGWNEIRFALTPKMRALNPDGKYMVYMAFIEAARTPLVQPFYIDHIWVE